MGSGHNSFLLMETSRAPGLCQHVWNLLGVTPQNPFSSRCEEQCGARARAPATHPQPYSPGGDGASRPCRGGVGGGGAKQGE